MTSVAAISIAGLTKDFAIGLRGTRLRAVDRLSLRIGQGEVFGLMGPNGSGKSTTIKLILDLIPATAGQCLIFGVPHDQVAARAMVGYLPESPQLHRHLTGRELVRFHGGLGGLTGRRLASRVEEVISRVGLGQAADRRLDTYSKGMLQRAGLAQAIMHHPRLVILDEPAAGMDPAGSDDIRNLVLGLKAEGRTVVIVSHQLEQMEDVCDRMAILDRGRLVWEGSREDLIGADGRCTLEVDPLSADQLAELRRWLGERGKTFREIGSPRSRLAEIFRRQTMSAQTMQRSPE